MTTLEERLDAIKPRKLDLEPGVECGDRSVHRPDFRVCAGYEEDSVGAIVSLSIGALWGQQLRFASLTPTEARQLAQLLIGMAGAVDTEVAAERAPQYSVTQTAERIKDSAR